MNTRMLMVPAIAAALLAGCSKSEELKARQKAREAGNEIKESLQEVKQKAKEAGRDLKDELKDVGADAKRGLEKARSEVKRGVPDRDR